mmetsp:Transcript_7253/g.11641  ORF Transcript_7253/g.11641 Transcript_7253/m.11641 type:complete len:555 (+) Transcript_7253:2-1666(+)
MFGTLEPDFSGDKPISGSHHTLAFYRKGIGFFMPGGVEDWEPLAKTGNPSRSKEVRDLINKVKDLNNDGTATPKGKQKKKRSSEDGGGDQKQSDGDKQKKKAKKSVEKKSAEMKSTETPFAVSEEVNDLLRQMHTQKNKFLRGLEQMSAAVEKMKSDVEISYGLMIGQVSNIGSRIVTAQIAAPVAGASAVGPAPLPYLSVPRSRNLFTIWSVENGKLTPLAADWTFPMKLTVIEAMNGWMLGEPASHTPPLHYVTIGHMKHIKGAADNFTKVRRFMKIAKYLGLKAGYWCENWDSERIATLWSKIWPGIETHLGQISNDTKDGNGSCRTMINSLAKNGGIIQEMADNPQILSDELVASFAARSTEEASRGALTSNEGGETEGASARTPNSRDLELLWGIHHGKLNPLPTDWEFPTHHSIIDILNLWLLGEPERKIPPLRYINSSYVGYLKSGTGYLSKLRCVMKVINHVGVKLECWYEEDWDEEKISTLWYTVWDDIEERIKFKNTQGRNGAVTWQSVYNKMHEKGVIKEVNADQDKDAADQEKDADQDLEGV